MARAVLVVAVLMVAATAIVAVPASHHPHPPQVAGALLGLHLLLPPPLPAAGSSRAQAEVCMRVRVGVPKGTLAPHMH